MAIATEKNVQAVVEPTRQRRKEARPGELIAAALDLFVQKGFAATRLDDVARQAGVSKGTLYLYFDSKEALFKAAINEGLVPALMEVGKLTETYDGDTRSLMETLVLRWWHTVGDTSLGGIPKLVISEARNFPEIAHFYQHEVIGRSYEMIGRVIRRGIARGDLRQVDVESTTALLFAPLLMLAVWRHSLGACNALPEHPFADPEKFLRAHVDVTLYGLLAQSRVTAG